MNHIMLFFSSPIKREILTVTTMIQIYCRNHHESSDHLCEECETLREYAHKRLEKCSYGEDKPACNHCPIHCYQKEMKEKTRIVMRYAGPRMLLRHPVMTFFHLLNKNKKVPQKFSRKKDSSDL